MIQDAAFHSRWEDDLREAYDQNNMGVKEIAIKISAAAAEALWYMYPNNTMLNPPWVIPESLLEPGELLGDCGRYFTLSLKGRQVVHRLFALGKL